MTDVFVGRKFRVRVGPVDLPDGRVQPHFEMVVHHGAVVVAAQPAPEEVLMVRQYRPAVGGWLLELPAGTIEPGEDPAVCAGRELIEECGFAAGRLRPLGKYYSSPGISTECLHLYLAEELTPTAQALEEHEVLSVVRMPLAEALARAAAGEIADAKTLAGLLLLSGSGRG